LFEVRPAPRFDSEEERVGVPNNFELAGTRGYFRPAGCVPLDEAIDLVTGALAFACEQGANQLLVDVSGLTGFPSPNVAERYYFCTKWAEVVAGRLRVAFVARPELIDPNKFGVTVATNRGLESDVFATETEALAWLDRRPESRSPRSR
jgi:hypothetical protein